MLDARRTGLAEGAATLLSSHAEHPRPATSDTTKGSQAHRTTASKRVSSPPGRTLSSASEDTDHRIETASLIAIATVLELRVVAVGFGVGFGGTNRRIKQRVFPRIRPAS